MRIEIGKRARRQVERESDWWAKNRPYAPTLFDDELAAAFRRLLTEPACGVGYPTARRPGLRRILLPRSEYHVYFALERGGSVIAIHSVWGARREREPAL